MLACCYFSTGQLISGGAIQLLFFLQTIPQIYNVNKQEVVNQGPEILDKKVAREFTVHIDRFAYIFRYDWCFFAYILYFA